MKRIAFVVMMVAFTAACSGANKTSQTIIKDPSKTVVIKKDNDSEVINIDCDQKYRECMRTNRDDGMCRMIAIRACSGGGMGMGFIPLSYGPHTTSYNADAWHPAVVTGNPGGPATLGTNAHLATTDQLQRVERKADGAVEQSEANRLDLQQLAGSGK